MSILEAAMQNDIEEIKKAVLEGNVDEQDEESGYTALHYSAQNGNIEITEFLLKNKASVSIKDNYGNTALFKAVFFSQGKTEIIKLLLDAGANADEENNAGMSPRELAESIATFDVTEVFK